MRSIYYLRTNDPSKVVRIPSHKIAGPIEIVENNIPDTDFHLSNTLTNTAMQQVRKVVKNAGLKLKEVKRMAIRFKQDSGKEELG